MIAIYGWPVRMDLVEFMAGSIEIIRLRLDTAIRGLIKKKVINFGISEGNGRKFVLSNIYSQIITIYDARFK